MAHPATRSSVPTALTAQMPRPTVQAIPFQTSRQVPRQVPVKKLDDLSFRQYNKFQDKVDALGFIPIREKGQFIPPPPTNFALMEGMVKKQLVPPDNLAFQEDMMDAEGDTGEDMSGKGMKKGSSAMKAHMAKLRAMRKKK